MTIPIKLYVFCLLLIKIFDISTCIEEVMAKRNNCKFSSYKGTVNCLTISEKNIFAGTEGNGIFLSTNSGESWNPSGLSEEKIKSISINGNSIFAGTTNGVFLSTDNGSNWNSINNNLPENFTLLAIQDNIIFAGTFMGIYLSTNNGTNWNLIYYDYDFPIISISAIITKEDNLFVGTGYKGIFHSSNKGESWSFKNNGLSQEVSYTDSLFYSINTFAVNGQFILAGTEGDGVYLSSNNGESWNFAGLSGENVKSIAIKGNNIFAGTTHGVFLSSDNGDNWIDVNIGLSNVDILSLAVNGNNIFVGTYNYGIFKSTNNGEKWFFKGVFDLCISDIVINENDIIINSDYGIFYSNNKCKSWTYVTNELTNKGVTSLAIYDNSIFAGTYEKGVYLSTNNGEKWILDSSLILGIFSVAINENKIFICTNKGLYHSPIKNRKWTKDNNILSNRKISFIYSSGNFLLAGSLYEGAFLSTNNGISWYDVGFLKSNITSFLKTEDNLYIGTDKGLYRSKNNGKSWNEIDKGISNRRISSLATNGKNLFVGTHGSGIFLTINKGKSWRTVNNGLSNLNVLSLFVNGNNIFAGTCGEGMFMSTNNGEYWSK